MKKSFKCLIGIMVLLLVAACGGGGGSDETPAASSSGSGSTVTPTAIPTDVSAMAAVTPTSTLPAISTDKLTAIANAGYKLEEYAVSGKANVYDWLDDGSTPIQAGKANAPYTTRILVLKPSDPKKFVGNVLVELDPYTGFSALSELGQDLIMNRGWAYVGINVKPLALKQLKAFNATRYASLAMATPVPLDASCVATLTSDYPSDSEEGLCWDMIAQLGALLKSSDAKNPLKGLAVQNVYMTGVSQGGMYILDFMNAGFHAKSVNAAGNPVYDAYFLDTGHGRIKPINQCAAMVAFGTPRSLFKGVAPFIIMTSESDANAFDALKNRRSDSDLKGDQFRLYEITGTTHAGTPPPGVVAEPIPNDYPFAPFARGALMNLDTWVRNGTPPPKADRILYTNPTVAEANIFPVRYGISVKDEFGNSVGGVRSPYLDVPIFTYNAWYTSLVPIAVPSGTSGSATATRGWLFGFKTPLSDALIQQLYGTHQNYEQLFNTGVDRLVADRWVLPEDSFAMKDEAAQANILGGGTSPSKPVACADIAKVSFKDMTFDKAIAITSTTAVDASGTTPAYCDVKAVIWPETEFRIKMPKDASWNRRLYYNGGGGYDGSVASVDAGLNTKTETNLFYASAGTNGGHTGPASDFYATPTNEFAEQKIKDFGYRAHYEGATLAKKLANAYYGSPPTRSYWVGCSNGGREGMIMAERYPDVFDGYVIGAPALGYSAVTMSGNWRSQLSIGDTTLYDRVATLNPQYALSNQSLAGAAYAAYANTKLKTLSDVIYAQCDALDGLADGLIADPEKCTFIYSDASLNAALSAAGVMCPGNVDASGCFTLEQVTTLRKIYDGPRDSAGTKLLFGFYGGGEVAGFNFMLGGIGSGWLGTVVGAAPGAPGDGLHADYYKYMAFKPPKGPEWDWKTLDFDRDPQEVAASGIIDILDATSPNLWAVKNRGAKIIMWHGLSDGLISSMQSTDYYKHVITHMGDTTTKSFYKYYMVPGVFHCGAGVGCGTVDWLSKVVDWVEKGTEPAGIIGTGTFPIARSRVHCPYPLIGKYTGTGSVDDAANFQCQ